MAHKPFEEDDPLELIGVEVSGPFATEDDCLEEMARTFIDEYARIGWNRDQLLKLFGDPFYQGPHAIYQARGEAFVQQLIAERLPAAPPSERPSAAQAGMPEDYPPAPVDEACAGHVICQACPVGRSFGKTQCPMKKTAHGMMVWIKSRLFRRSPDA